MMLDTASFTTRNSSAPSSWRGPLATDPKTRTAESIRARPALLPVMERQRRRNPALVEPGDDVAQPAGGVVDTGGSGRARYCRSGSATDEPEPDDDQVLGDLVVVSAGAPRAHAAAPDADEGIADAAAKASSTDPRCR